jgi:hypothetical protein
VPEAAARRSPDLSILDENLGAFTQTLGSFPNTNTYSYRLHHCALRFNISWSGPGSASAQMPVCSDPLRPRRLTAWLELITCSQARISTVEKIMCATSLSPTRRRFLATLAATVPLICSPRIWPQRATRLRANRQSKELRRWGRTEKVVVRAVRVRIPDKALIDLRRTG